MAGINKEDVIAALRGVREPELGKDLVSLGMIRDLEVSDSRVSFKVVLTTPACPLKQQITSSAKEAVEKVPGVSEVEVTLTSNVTSGRDTTREELIPGVKNVIAVSSGKGGVGKSTVSVYLALALAMDGAKVGLLDCDIYGPNIPLMMGIKERPEMIDDKIIPLVNYNISLMSMGFIIPDDQPVIWRGPMLHKVIQQFLGGVEWGELDYMIVDLPPGTGDAQMSICQLVPLTGAVIVTTPQEVALLDSRRGLAMFQKLGVPVLGIIENMSYFSCPHCQGRTEIFSHGGGKEASLKLGVPFLGEIPIDTDIRKGGDSGVPVIIVDSNSPQAGIFHDIASNLAARISVSNAFMADQQQMEKG